ncbi:hypothetical protein MSAN_02246700 [Mycena sanguinolenta]|uniref:Uncharacterized protein n=1 Tax=Mycena sanguinolenta TaxID=230812 RepID=A0A8H6XBU6_9AGAR|nr:hypothetical protein MSAN_02246700 [Mycena sanguinolenta]
MSIILFLRALWKRLALCMSPGSLRIDGLWDGARLRTEAKEDIKAWKNGLLLHPRREALNNGVVVTRVEHLKDGSDKNWEHEFLRIHVLHQKSKKKLVLIVDRNFSPKDFRGPPERNGEALRMRGKNDQISNKKDLPEERGLSLVITRVSGVVHYSEPFFPTHKVLDRVHRGFRDLEKRTSPNILELQTLTFPECSRPSVINLAFFLAALSEFAPQYHVGEYQGYWFAHAAIDGMHSAFRGKLRPGANIHAMGKWKNASFKYVNPSTTIVAEYGRQLKQYEDAFRIIQLAGRRLGVQEGQWMPEESRQGRHGGTQIIGREIERTADGEAEAATS